MSIQFSYAKTCGVRDTELHNLVRGIMPFHEHLQKIREEQYQEPLGFINLPFDTEYIEEIMACAQQKKALNPTAVLLIGIGGSNLGACAVYEALRGKYYNENAQAFNAPLFYCADTLDVDKNTTLKNILEKILQCGENILIISGTKSGSTTETTLNTEFFIALLKKYRPENYHDYVVMITDKDSTVWHTAQQEGYAKLAIPKNVGGRFSVLSAVGLFPLAMLNVDISALCAGARAVTDHCLSSFENDAAISAAVVWSHYQKGIIVHDSFLFDAGFETLGKWYRQLMAESLGKDGKGILPTVSMGTVDLHSMAQLYFAGPSIRCTTFFPAIIRESTTMAHVQNVIFEGVQAAYAQAKLPFMTLNVEKNEKALGALLQFKMLEIVYLGHCMQVNAFNQPQVELYKQEVRKLL